MARRSGRNRILILLYYEKSPRHKAVGFFDGFRCHAADWARGRVDNSADSAAKQKAGRPSWFAGIRSVVIFPARLSSRFLIHTTPCQGQREQRVREASSSRTPYPSPCRKRQSSLILSLLLSQQSRIAALLGSLVSASPTSPRPYEKAHGRAVGIAYAFGLVQATHVRSSRSSRCGGLRRRGRHIPRPAASGRARSFCRSFSPNKAA